MKFAPIKFQAALAAGGVSLMAFNFLQFDVDHAGSLVKLADIKWAALPLGKTLAYAPITLLMLALTAMNLIFTLFLLKGLAGWLFKGEYKKFMENPLTNISIFVPIASLSMTVNVIWGPMAFFFPKLSAEAMMPLSLGMFAILWIALFTLEFKVVKMWIMTQIDGSKLNFVWLLDVFAFGLVSLTGTGIASMAADPRIAAIATIASLFVLTIGIFLFFAKLSYLIYMQLKSVKLPDTPILPAFFLVVPITCLFGLSLYRILLYLETAFSFDISVISYVLINVSYIITIGWGIFIVYLLINFLMKDFYRSQFSPTQWGMV